MKLKGETVLIGILIIWTLFHFYFVAKLLYISLSISPSVTLWGSVKIFGTKFCFIFFSFFYISRPSWLKISFMLCFLWILSSLLHNLLFSSLVFPPSQFNNVCTPFEKEWQTCILSKNALNKIDRSTGILEELTFNNCYKLCYYSEIKRDKTMTNNLMYIPNYDTQNNPFCR